jgi:hypothetical protein
MFNRSKNPMPAALFCLLLILAGCSGGNNAVLPDGTRNNGDTELQNLSAINPGPATVVGTDGPRCLWGIYTITVTPDWQAFVEPARDIAGHLNVTIFLKPPYCTNCIKLQIVDKDTTAAWVKINVGLANPVTLAGYDVRGIILGDDDYYLMNPDARTPYAGKLELDPPQGFEAFATDQPDNKFPAKVPGDPVYFYREFQIHIPPPYEAPKLLQIQYAVDASWPGNCEDPWSIGDLDLEAPMYSDTPSLKFSIDVKDHQDDVEYVTLTPPADWGGDEIALTKGSGEKWEGVFDGCLGKTPGTYLFEAKAVSLDQATGTIELPLYRDLPLEVMEEDCSGDPKADPSGAETLLLSGEVWDTLCTDNAMDYYLINFSSPSMQSLGVLSGTVTLESCVPYQRAGLVYYNVTTTDFYDGPYATGSADGTVVFRVHIPNSEFIGNSVEKCYLRISGPESGAIDNPYKLTTDLEFLKTGCGDPVSLSTVGAPDIQLSDGMVQGVLCDDNQRDWYRLDASGAGIEPGRLTGSLTAEIEYPDPVPAGEVVAVSLRDEDGTLLANFYETLDTPLPTVDLATLDLPSLFVYYICLSRPESTSVNQYYMLTWDTTVDPTCTEDSIEPDSPDAPYISPGDVPWSSNQVPGSSVRMWMCDPDDTIDAYPFDVPDTWPGMGEVMGGTIHIQTDPLSYGSLEISLGLEETSTNAFSWLKPIVPTGPDVVYNISDFWNFPTDFDQYPLKGWIRVRDNATLPVTAQLEMNLAPSVDCTGDTDSENDPSGDVVPEGTMTGLLNPSTDSTDYWELDWEGEGRIEGDIGVVSEEEVRLRLYSKGALLEEDQGLTPSVPVDAYDFGPGCFGPIIRLDSVGGSPGQCIQYYITGAGLNEFSSCVAGLDMNDTLDNILDKPWMWVDPLDTFDELCGVVCRSGSDEDVDCVGILGQPFATQGVLYGFFSIRSTTPEGHQVSLVSMNGDMKIGADNLQPPFYSAVLELAEYNLPAIPPAGYRYNVLIEPDPTGADSLNPYRLLATLGINSDPLCPGDGHDSQAQAWPLEIPESRLGILCGFGSLLDIDNGIPDLCDWFVLDYDQQAGEYLEGTITLECDIEGVTVRLMPENEPAGTGLSLYEASIPSGESSVDIDIPDDTIPSIPALGDDYYIAVHNNGVGGWAAYALIVNLTSQ